MFPRQTLLTVALLLATALAYLLGNGAATLFDRDEPRYALTSRNMLASGDYIVPRQFENKPRTAKPPLIYWLQAGSMRVFGTTSAFAARLPSSVAMWLTVALLLAFLRREADSTTALLAATLFATSGLTLFLAKAAITDATLAVFTAMALGCLYRFWRGDRAWGTFILFGIATGFSFLTKGPITLGVLGMTLAALGVLSLIERKFPPRASWKTFPTRFSSPEPSPTSTGKLLPKLIVTALIFAAIALPWFAAVEMRSEGFLSKVISNDLKDRLTKGVDGQARPPGFYLLTVFGTYFPYSLFLPAALTVGWLNRHRPLTRFALAACIGPWLMFEASTSKMVHWFLPVFLPLSYLTADAIMRCWNGAAHAKYPYLSDRPFRYFSIFWGVLVAAMGLGAWLLVIGRGTAFGVPWWTALLLSVWSIAFGVTAAYFLFRSRIPQAVITMSGAMLVLFPLLFGLILPNWSFMNLSRRVGEALEQQTAQSVRMTSFREPAAAFYQTHPIREAELSALYTPPFPDIVTVNAADFDTLNESVRSQWQVVSTHRGIAYADSPKLVDVYVLRKVR